VLASVAAATAVTRLLVFHRPVLPARNQLFVMNADGTGEHQITSTADLNNLLANWGVLRVKG
jgi:hypothetical protein